MEISIPYGKEVVSVIVDSHVHASVVEPNDVQSGTNPQTLILDALCHPFASSDSLAAQDLDTFLSGSGSILVIVNDGTRPTPTNLILHQIANRLETAKAHFLVATGTHRRPTEVELQYIFGDNYERFFSHIHVHDARNMADMVYFGTTKCGTRVLLNSMVAKADRIMVIGSVEPHYFAGYTGGRKAFLPGVAAFRSIEQNHGLALSPLAQTLALDGNPVHDDMVEALDMVKKPIFSIMTVLDKNQELYAVTTGDITLSFEVAVEKAKEVFVVPIAEKADVVVSIARHPMDVNLYQAHKALENGRCALREGGTLLLVAACSDGVGDTAFINLLGSCNTPQEMFDIIKGEYHLGYHKAAKVAELVIYSNVVVYTELEATILEHLFFQKAINLQRTLDDALAGTRSDGKTPKTVLFLMDGCVTVPQKSLQDSQNQQVPK
jgi:lactate racemase